MAKYNFILSLPGNSKKLKRAFLGLTIMCILCVAGMVLGEMFWDQYTYKAYSFRAGTTVTRGWPASLFNWSLWLLVAGIICTPMLFFMQDFKNPSIGLMENDLFLNQQLMRNTVIPYSNIKMITTEGDKFKILFKDESIILKQQIFLFKPFIKSNLMMGNFMISGMHSAGDVKGFMEELKKRIPSAES